jgi:hypothetical protein
MTDKKQESYPSEFRTDFRNTDISKLNVPYNQMTMIVKNLLFWERVSKILLILLTISLLVNFYIFKRKPLVPYLVTVTANGEVLDLGEVEYGNNIQPTDAQVSYFLAKIIKNLREVPATEEQFQIQLQEVSNFMSKPVLTRLWNIDKQSKENILRTGGRRFTDKITIVKIPNQPAFDVRWQEITIDINGVVVERNYFQSTLSVSITPPTTKEELRTNPIGIFIEDMTTSKNEI